MASHFLLNALEYVKLFLREFLTFISLVIHIFEDI